MNEAIPLAKNILAPLRITAAASGIQKKKQKRSSRKTTLIISNKEINDILKAVQALEDFNIPFKVVTKTIEN